MKIGALVLTAVLSAAVAFGVARYAAPVGEQAETRKETAYERVMRTGTLRCGYLFWTKILEKDPQTGAFSGMYYDLMNEIGRQLSLKIEWTEEATLVSAFDGLKAGRYDVFCTPLNATPARARETAFTLPIFYGPAFFYARANDTRFDNAYGKINDPKVRIAILEGEQAQIVRQEDYPKAQELSLPAVSDISQVLLQVAMGKADVVLTEPVSAEHFLAHNPGKLKRVPGPPVRISAVGLDVAVHETALKQLLDATIFALQRDGFVEKTVSKYAVTPDSFLYAAQPYRDLALKEGRL